MLRFAFEVHHLFLFAVVLGTAALLRVRKRMQIEALARLVDPNLRASLAPLPELSGAVFMPGDEGYPEARYQYATTSQAPAAMMPGAIVRPRGPNADRDIVRLLEYARKERISITVRSGGHAYNGTSSCSVEGIQLDLREAYRDWDYDEVAGTIRMGVSHSLFEMYERLRAIETSPGNSLFVPIGQCCQVFVGGHAQTGGYGQLARGFGLFADFIVSAELFTADGTKHFIAPDAPSPADRELFWAVFGSGPGNFGVLTHITVKPGRDEDHPDSRAYRAVVPYTKGEDSQLMIELGELVHEFEQAPRGYDICITWSSAEERYMANVLGLGGQADSQGPPQRNFSAAPYPCMIVYFQYSNPHGPGEVYDPSWCQRLEDIVARRARNLPGEAFSTFVRAIQGARSKLPDDSSPTPISVSMSHLWMFYAAREFNYPVKKYTAFTDKPASPEFASWCVEQVEPLMDRQHEGIMVLLQFLQMGGEASMHRRYGDTGKTSFSWRDSAFVVVMDVFYNPDHPGAQAEAEAWNAKLIAEGMGPSGKIGRQDRRWIWSPFGERDMQRVWPKYYDSEQTYARALAAKASVDPTGIFSATSFHLQPPGETNEHG